MRASTAKKILHDFRSYDRERDRRIQKLEAALSQTLDDLRSLRETPKRRRKRA